MDEEGIKQRIPISVLTGFLGSGKTTVLRHFARSGSLSRTLVLVNEFGEVGLDHHLLTPIDDDTLVALDSGCICCTIRADLSKTLSEAPWRYSRDGVRWFDQVIIETTGVADPAPVLQTILGDPKVIDSYGLLSVLTVVDAVNGISTLKEHAEAVKQVAVADRVLLTKTDLLQGDQDKLNELQEVLRELAPSARIDKVVDGQAEMDWFFGEGPYSIGEKNGDVRSWLNDEFEQRGTKKHYDHLVDVSRHGSIVASHLTFSEPVDAALFESCLQMLMNFRGPDLLRVKGIINIAGMDLPMVIHGVQHVFHPPEILDKWPDGDRSTRVVIIARDFDQEQIAACFNGFGLPVDKVADA